jgi:hypothetical protein
MKKDRTIQKMSFDKEGHRFYWWFVAKEKQVYVECDDFIPGKAFAEASAVSPEIMANILASEILSQKKRP